MKIVVLGGGGIQGRTAVMDLARNREVAQVICADLNPEQMVDPGATADGAKVRAVRLDAGDPEALVPMMASADAVIDLLPRHLMPAVCHAAIRAGTSLVNTNYAYEIAHLDARARDAGVAIMPECGLDPGIDLVIYGEAKRRFDELHAVYSYCGGLPEAAACDNPLKYKVSWTWEGVLSSTMRDSRIMRDGVAVEIPAARQHNPEFVHQIEFPGLGTLEAIPNGRADFFIRQLGIENTVRDTGRYSLRWPGWSAFWRPLKQLGFFSRQPIAGLSETVTPYEVLDKLLGPQLQYRDHEKDLVAMVNVFQGLRAGRRTQWTIRLLIERDLDTGLMAMSKGVGYPAAIAARMLAAGRIEAKGLLSPALHLPHGPFMEALARRGIHVAESEEVLD